MKIFMRIVNAVIAAAIFPVALFLKFIFIQIGTNESAQPILNLVGSEYGGVGIKESLSIFDFIQIARGDHVYSGMFGNSTEPFTWPKAFDPINAKLIAFAVFFAICLLVAIFVIVWSICSSKRLPVIIASVVGLISSIIMIICFNSAANVITSGEIPIKSILGSSGFLSNILFGFVSVDTLMLGGFQSGFIIIFVCLFVWTGAFALIELGDTSEKKK
ncbi:MAG: hypothetical protein IKB88_07420 [Clostridia bacterium]|nr:hypothetical protein [Clostridia bacterium]